MLKLLVVHAYTACLAPEIKPLIIPRPVSSTKRAYREGCVDIVLFPLMSHLEESRKKRHDPYIRCYVGNLLRNYKPLVFSCHSQTIIL